MVVPLWRRELSALSATKAGIWKPFFSVKNILVLGASLVSLGTGVAAGRWLPYHLVVSAPCPTPGLRLLLLLWGCVSWSPGTTVEAPLHSESGEGLAPLFRDCLNWGLWRRSPSPALGLDSPSDNHMSKGERRTPSPVGILSLPPLPQLGLGED